MFTAYGKFTAGQIKVDRVDANNMLASNIAASSGLVAEEILALSNIAAPSIAAQEIAATIAIAAPQIASNIQVIESYTLSETSNNLNISRDSVNKFTFTP